MTGRTGSRIETTWEPGSPITWSGEYDGHAYHLERDGDVTRLTLEQDNTPEESVADFTDNWQTVLENLKRLVERG